MDKTNIGEFLREYRKENKKRLKDVAELLGTTTSYLSQIENGIRHPSDKNLVNILIKGFDLRNSEAEGLVKRWRIKMYDPDVETSTQYIYDKSKGVSLIPYYEEIEGAIDQSQPANHWPFPFNDQERAKNFFVYQMKDESMEPAIPQGAYLIIDKNAVNIDSQSIILANAENKILCRLYKPIDENAKLIPANHTHPVFYGKNFKILGKIEAVLLEITNDRFIQ